MTCVVNESRNVKTAPSTPEAEIKAFHRNKSASSFSNVEMNGTTIAKRVPKVATDPVLSARKSPSREDSPKSRKKSKNEKFHKLFKSIPEEETVLNSYSCAYIGDILLQGILYISGNYFCFHSRILGHQKQIVIHVSEVLNLTREKTAFIIPNAIGILTCQDKYVFGSLMQRDTTYKLMNELWRNCKNNSGFQYGSRMPINRSPSPGSDDISGNPQIEVFSGSGTASSQEDLSELDPSESSESRLFEAQDLNSTQVDSLSQNEYLSPDIDTTVPPDGDMSDSLTPHTTPPPSPGCHEVKKALGHIIVTVRSMPKERQLSLLSIIMLMNLLLTMTAYSYCVVSLQSQVDSLSSQYHPLPPSGNPENRNQRLESLYGLIHDYNMASLQELQGDLKANLQRLKDLQSGCSLNQDENHDKIPDK